MNLILHPFQSVTVHDTRETTLDDLGVQFFLRQEDAEKSVNRYKSFYKFYQSRSLQLTYATTGSPIWVATLKASVLTSFPNPENRSAQ